MNRWAFLATSLLAAFPGLGSARTIILTDVDCERMAFIQEQAPRWGWGGYDLSPDSQANMQFFMYSNRAFLIAFPIERIPKGQRIVHAELTFTIAHQSAGEQRLTFRRLLASWGAGVCWDYRSLRPEKLKWASAGARGVSTDRATKASAVVRCSVAGERSLNVTEDVELWYTGAAPNHGWAMTLEDPDVYVVVNPPTWSTRGTWKLRITYEPEK